MFEKVTKAIGTKRLLEIVVFLLLSSTFCYCDSDVMEEAPESNRMLKFAANNKIFALELLQTLTFFKPNENVVFSPLSVQTAAAMARLGATGKTAEELDKGLHLISTDANEIGESFHSILQRYRDSEILKIANKIYIMQGNTIKPRYNEILLKKFFTSAEELDFKSDTAAQTINAWVEEQTNKLIKQLVSPSAIGADTRLVILNAIHFKGEWVHKFRKFSTHEHDFYLNEVDTVKVQMMSQKERFLYADLPELDATAVELPYKDTDLTMLIILPNSRTGLKSTMEKLKEVSLSDISERLTKVQVLLKIPKFKAEFEIELNDAFKKMGMARMFSMEAEFNEMLESPEPLQVSKIIHKAFINVDEEGTEAAAATAVLVRKKRSSLLEPDPKEFFAEHPFLYFINHIESESVASLAGEAENSPKISLQAKKSVLPFFMGAVASQPVAPTSTTSSTTHEEL